MTRNGGSTIDTQRHQVLDRNGLVYPIDALAVSPEGVYYRRLIEGNDHFWHQERWVLDALGWVINRFAFHPHRDDSVDWYIETELIEHDGDTWRIRDGYLDVYVHEGNRYELEDAGELADGMTQGEITIAEVIAALHALDRLCESLRANGCSGHALLREFAPSLPASSITRDAAGVFALNVK